MTASSAGLSCKRSAWSTPRRQSSLGLVEFILKAVVSSSQVRGGPFGSIADQMRQSFTGCNEVSGASSCDCRKVVNHPSVGSRGLGMSRSRSREGMWPSQLLPRGMELVRELKDAAYGKAKIRSSACACMRLQPWIRDRTTRSPGREAALDRAQCRSCLLTLRASMRYR